MESLNNNIYFVLFMRYLKSNMLYVKIVSCEKMKTCNNSPGFPDRELWFTFTIFRVTPIAYHSQQRNCQSRTFRCSQCLNFWKVAYLATMLRSHSNRNVTRCNACLRTRSSLFEIKTQRFWLRYWQNQLDMKYRNDFEDFGNNYQTSDDVFVAEGCWRKQQTNTDHA